MKKYDWGKFFQKKSLTNLNVGSCNRNFWVSESNRNGWCGGRGDFRGKTWGARKEVTRGKGKEGVTMCLR